MAKEIQLAAKELPRAEQSIYEICARRGETGVIRIELVF